MADDRRTDAEMRATLGEAVTRKVLLVQFVDGVWIRDGDGWAKLDFWPGTCGKHEFGPWRDDPAGVARECAFCGLVESRPEA